MYCPCPGGGATALEARIVFPSGFQDVPRAEMVALVEAVERLPDMGSDWTWHIFTDSLACLCAIRR